jgi:hypothetical protein
MQNAESLSRDQIQEFLRSSEPIEFTSGGREQRYLWVEQVLAAQNFAPFPLLAQHVNRRFACNPSQDRTNGAIAPCVPYALAHQKVEVHLTGRRWKSSTAESVSLRMFVPTCEEKRPR